MTNEEIIEEFRKNALDASYHHADDSGKEWGLAKPYERRCQEIYDAADEALKAELFKIKGEYLISIIKAPVKHTPGPWRVASPPDKVCTDYRDEDGSMLNRNWGHGGHAKTIVTCERRSWMAEGEEFANAQLIAAAPDLLAALEEIEQQARRHKHSTAENNGTHIALENIENLAKRAIATAKEGA